MMSPSLDFDPKTYWEGRLAGGVGIRQVGNRRFGRCYNWWLYLVRRAHFTMRMRRLFRAEDRSALRVLDVGSGSGVYVDLWQRLGVGHVVASDLTLDAVAHLRRTFPRSRVQRGDVGEPGFLQGEGPFDVVSAFDVLFHVVDDERLAQAIANIARLLKPGGYFVFTDLFLHGPVFRSPHQAGRTLEHLETLLREAGFQILERRPVFVLMEAPVDSRSVLHRRFWRSWRDLVSKGEVIGAVAGAAASPLELVLASFLPEGPSIEMMVCRRAAGA